MHNTLPYSVQLEIGTDEPICLEFLDNDFVKKVFEKFRTHIQSNHQLDANKFNYPFGGLAWNTIEVGIYENALVNIINDINLRSNIEFPIKPSNIKFTQGSMESRYLLNALHRYFTFLQESKFHSWDKINYCSKRVPKSGEYEKVFHNVKLINQIVHKLDKYYYVETFNTRVQEGRILDEFNIHFNSPNHDMVFMTEEDKIGRLSNNKDRYGVWLPLDRMRGKNLFDCYFDYDDPTNSDIENENTYDGSIAIGYREGFFNKNFNSWLEGYGVPLTIGIPLGYIASGTHQLKLLNSHSLKSIKIIEKSL